MDRTSNTALASILGLPLESLEAAKDSCFLASLPVKKGGLAMTNWVHLSPWAYTASSEGRSQKLITERLYKTALADPSNAASARHAALHCTKAASAYLSLSLETQLPPAHAVIAATLQRINWASNDERGATCMCGFEEERRKIWPHMAGCARYNGSAVNNRHHTVVNQLRLWCQDAGWHVRAEVALDARRRIDLLVDTPDKTIMVDVTVCSTKARSWTGYTEEEIQLRVAAGKKRSYSKFESKKGEPEVSLLTFFADVWGSISEAALSLLSSIYMCNPEGPSVSAMAARISTLVVIGTGKTAHRAGLLRAWDVNLGLSPYVTRGHGPNKAQEGVVTASKGGAEEEECPINENGVDPSGAAASAENVKEEPEDEEEVKKQLKSPEELKELETKMFATTPGSGQTNMDGSNLPGVAAPLRIVRSDPSLGLAGARFPNGGCLSDRPRQASADLPVGGTSINKE